MTDRYRRHCRAGLLAVAAAFSFAIVAPASAQPRRDDRGYHDYRGEHWDHHRDWHHRYGYGGGYYAPPPVVYSRPYYAPPPLVYSPGIGVNIHIP